VSKFLFQGNISIGCIIFNLKQINWTYRFIVAQLLSEVYSRIVTKNNVKK